MARRTDSLQLPIPRPARVAVLGVGNDMNGDDGAGVCVVRALAAAMAATPGVLLIDGGTAPENFTGPLRRFRPDLVVEIDAADQDQAAGTTAWIDWRDADGMSASTHTLPPSVLANFLSTDVGCRVALIGVQPATLEMGRGLSPAVATAVQQLAGQLSAWLSDDTYP
ncbi:MAG TPA: hydrogenase 3 maturation endopeptidase HyCI [Vicinamibacterales bacterium]